MGGDSKGMWLIKAAHYWGHDSLNFTVEETVDETVDIVLTWRGLKRETLEKNREKEFIDFRFKFNCTSRRCMVK